MASRPMTEEVQAAAASGFLSFVPFQILKRARAHSREIICIRSKKESLTSRPLAKQAGEGNRTLVCSLGSCRSTIELHPRGDFDFRFSIGDCNRNKRSRRCGSLTATKLHRLPRYQRFCRRQDQARCPIDRPSQKTRRLRLFQALSVQHSNYTDWIVDCHNCRRS